MWLRWFRLLFGNTAYAASATLCAFFAGLALGALLFGRLAGRTRRPLRAYALLELGVAATALLVPLVVQVYDGVYAALYASLAGQRPVFIAVKFALALAAVLPTATLLGGTLPMLGAAFVRDPARLGSRGGVLYAVNTFGAALGSAAGALWLPERIGVDATYGVALALSLAIALAGFGLSSRATAAPAPGAPAEDARAPTRLLAVSFASGAGTLALEVLLIHVLALSLAQSVYSFGAVLIVVLAGLALAAMLAAALSQRFPARSLLPGALALQAILLLLLPSAFVLGTGGLRLYAEPTFGQGLVLAAFYGGPAILVGGFALPLTFRLAEGGAVGPRLGGLLAANTVGAIVGSLAASFLLLDGIGLWPSFAVLAAGYAAVSLACPGSGSARLLRAGALAGGGAIVIGFANPLSLPNVLVGEGERLLAVSEGAHGVVSVTERVTGGLEIDRHLKVDNQYVLSGALAHPHQRRMGHLPLLIHPDPRRVVYVGSATGETASAALRHPVEEIVLVEIVPQVQALASVWFDDVNGGVYRSARTRVVIEDGRNHLRAAPERYDVVVADLFVPRHAGVGAMYSLEHFLSVRDHLTPGGVFCQWLPLYQLRESELEIVARTFLEVFPDATLWRGDFYVEQPTAALVGVAGPAPPVAGVDAAVRRLARAGATDRWVSDPRAFWMLYVGPVAAAFDGAGAPVHTDARPVFEYEAARSTEAERRAFRLRGWPALWRRVIEATATDDPVFPERPLAAAWAGAAMARATSLVHAGGEEKLDEAVSLLRANVPADLLDPPDRTVAEVWPTAGR